MHCTKDDIVRTLRYLSLSQTCDMCDDTCDMGNPSPPPLPPTHTHSHTHDNAQQLRCRFDYRDSVTVGDGLEVFPHLRSVRKQSWSIGVYSLLAGRLAIAMEMEARCLSAPLWPSPVLAVFVTHLSRHPFLICRTHAQKTSTNNPTVSFLPSHTHTHTRTRVSNG